ncbi:nucleolar GTP-binding protein [Wilcoxina mikolae CBS 423.85]|nr:nucleolar GTP-binding protein [Wilcoxina mikolae CBS 423.85]
MVLAESKNRVGLGRALMRSRGGGTRVTRGSGQAGRGKGRGSQGPMEMAFAPERKEADWVKIRSITEQNDLDEFLATAEMADTDFTAEKMSHVQVVHQDQYNPYILTADQERKVIRKQAAHSQHLTVPRRPKWDSQTTPQELDQLERESFLSWRRGLAELQETKDMLMTPFERNLEVWRQLWRVIERSDLVVQIVDARNPLLFRCVDLEKYVQEVDPKKKNLLLVNKADMMTTEQRKLWADYFEKEGVSYRFFSAALARAGLEEDFEDVEEGDSEVNEVLASETEKLDLAISEPEDPRIRIITISELETIFLSNSPPISTSNPRKTTIGLVGYPNVGKSSTINALIGSKKVSVSSTPGKTKHFQTLHLSDRIILCDCPGLVFPNFASTKAELVCNGILPIDQQREFTGPATLVAQRIPQWFLEALYGIKIITRPLEEGGTGIPTGTELLVAYARARGFMKTSAGNPDDSRAARYVLKDYINGKLLFCHPPPGGINPTEFNAGLYEDESRLPKHRRKLPAHNEDAASVLSGSEIPGDYEKEEEEEEEMVSLAPPPPEGRKTAAMDVQFFGRGVGAGGHLSNPFLAASSASSAAAGGRVLSGRKAKTMIAIENNLSPDEVAALKGSKKHFKGGKRKKQVKRVEEEDGEVLS